MRVFQAFFFFFGARIALCGSAFLRLGRPIVLRRVLWGLAEQTVFCRCREFRWLDFS
jgi:hypothetical protein